ncbi:Piso0_000905 [Millerozyma farinosa CBS 7064]|uniref:Probable cytosolic iron-sulfur protein assembly protein 1 n=1 Tax=Pichia sorbitophila (strain ATCC MYA-4447 / BCRC 22081 / CBS 7064 / NBRC 10061 / NRRL Y-12695) TaxID=559304 RepID=G8YRU8_PICSO|nr:Piso0_000905 [Millerozyma farinosa CBS 7064]
MKLIKSIKSHNEKAWCLSQHQTLPLLATASTDKTSIIYRLSAASDFPVIAKLEDSHKRSVRAVQFKPPLGGESEPVSEILDLPALACGSFDSTISIWGIEEPDELRELDGEDEQDIQKIHKSLLTSPKSEWSLMAIIEGHESEIKSVAWNYQGNLLASCSRDKTIWIWETDPETLEEFDCIAVLNDHSQDIKHVTWHPTQNLLASSSYDDTIRLYKQDEDDDEWACVGILNGHDGTVWCSSFEHPSAPGSIEERVRLVSASDDKTVRIWSSTSKEESTANSEKLPSSLKSEPKEMVWEEETVLPLAHDYPVYSVSWSKTSGRIASVGSDGNIVVYKEDGSKNWIIEDKISYAHGVFEVNCVIWCLLEDGEEALATAGDDGSVNLWRL